MPGGYVRASAVRVMRRRRWRRLGGLRWGIRGLRRSCCGTFAAVDGFAFGDAFAHVRGAAQTSVGHAYGGAWCDRVGGDVVAAEGVGAGLGEADQVGLGGDVVGLACGAVDVAVELKLMRRPYSRRCCQWMEAKWMVL